MSTDNWVTIFTNIIASAAVVWSAWYSVKNKNKESKEDPKKAAAKPKRNIVFGVSVILSVAISVFNIFTFVSEPVLSNVFILCVGVSGVVFVAILIIMNLFFSKIINTLKGHLGLTQGLIKIGGKDEKNTDRVLKIVESLSLSNSNLANELNDLKNRFDKIKIDEKK